MNCSRKLTSQPHEHLEVLVSRGPGKLQRLLWQILLDHGRPVTFAEIRGRARVGDSRERRARRALQGMVNHGVVIATGSGGKGDPYHYSMNPLIPVDLSPHIEMVVNADAEDILCE